jgi:hypothetical protein
VRIARVEVKISGSLSRVASRFTVCEQGLEELKSKGEEQNKTLVTRTANIEESLSLLRTDLERKISASLSPVTARLSDCETSLVMHRREINDVRIALEHLRAKAGVRRRQGQLKECGPDPEILAPSHASRPFEPVSPPASLRPVRIPKPDTKSQVSSTDEEQLDQQHPPAQPPGYVLPEQVTSLFSDVIDASFVQVLVPSLP